MITIGDFIDILHELFTPSAVELKPDVITLRISWDVMVADGGKAKMDIVQVLAAESLDNIVRHITSVTEFEHQGMVIRFYLCDGVQLPLW